MGGVNPVNLLRVRELAVELAEKRKLLTREMSTLKKAHSEIERRAASLRSLSQDDQAVLMDKASKEGRLQQSIERFRLSLERANRR